MPQRTTASVIATLTRCTFYNPKLASAHQQLPPGRVFALDVGKKRIGLAVSDELGITAQGIETLERTRIRDDLENLKQIAETMERASFAGRQPASYERLGKPPE